MRSYLFQVTIIVFHIQMLSFLVFSGFGLFVILNMETLLLKNPSGTSHLIGVILKQIVQSSKKISKFSLSTFVSQRKPQGILSYLTHFT